MWANLSLTKFEEKDESCVKYAGEVDVLDLWVGWSCTAMNRGKSQFGKRSLLVTGVLVSCFYLNARTMTAEAALRSRLLYSHMFSSWYSVAEHIFLFVYHATYTSAPNWKHEKRETAPSRSSVLPDFSMSPSDMGTCSIEVWVAWLLRFSRSHVHDLWKLGRKWCGSICILSEI